jgi:hypothetical protein
VRLIVENRVYVVDYEWHDALGGKQPYYFTPRDGSPDRSETLPINLLFMYYEYMARKQRGRPATGQVPVTAVRLPPELKSKVGAWANRQKDQPSLSEAIRRLLEKTLAGTIASSARIISGACRGTPSDPRAISVSDWRVPRRLQTGRIAANIAKDQRV